MRVLKHRLGFATNSSSSHSVVFAPGKNLQNQDVWDGGPASSDFGWGNWIAASTQAKRLYFALQFRSNLALMLGRVPEDYLNAIVAYFTSDVIPQDAQDIDHQSVLNFPRAYGKDTLDVEFYKAYLDMMLTQDVVVLGGNDNSDGPHPQASAGPSVNLCLPSDRTVDYDGGDYDKKPRCLVARHDEEFDQWLLFNQYTGEKTRLSFQQFQDEALSDEKYRYPNAALYRGTAASGFPELVDLKITNYCTRGCAWCYQKSTAKGRHADYQELQRLIHQMHDCGVLEVAIGGGEPTEHPKFQYIIRIMRDHDIIPNFSTGTLKWLDDPEILASVRRNCGGFAYTVRTPEDVDAFVKEIQHQNTVVKQGDRGSGALAFRIDPEDGGVQYNPDCPAVSIHIVMGTVTQEDFRTILEKAAAYHLPTTLLAYKAKGRGKKKAPIDYSWWLQETRDLQDRGYEWRVSVDTPMAAEWQTALNGAGVSFLHYDVREGLRSMYIDAVDHKIAPYSYCRDDEMQVLKHIEEVDTGLEPFDDETGELNRKVMDKIKRIRVQEQARGTRFLTKMFRKFRDATLAKKEK
ncbi:MAG: radical SAM protein [Patescibacteria group bacterium]